MKRLLSAVILATASAGAFAGTQCTEEPKDKWMTEEAFKAKLDEQGYAVKKFKVTSGNCYEIYGKNKDGKKVEIYFNPVDMSVVKSKSEDEDDDD